MTITPGACEDTRRLIARADPSASLAPLRGDEVARLLEVTMTNTTTPTNSASRRSNRRRWVIGGASGLAAAAAAAVVIPLAAGPAIGATSLEQPASGGPAAMCAEVTADAIASYDTAFSAQVASIDGGTVTLTVQDRLHGDMKNTVTVPQGDGAGIDGAPLVFVDGGDYLISTRDGMIITCGVSGENTPELSSLYQQAFPE